eukprot:9596745-Heterocapsa_arctica.AAC.1
MTHTMMEKHVHQQCQQAMTEGCGLAPEDMDDKLNIVQNSRFGWVPHTLIFKWLEDVWGKTLTLEMFWNMMLHTKNEKNQHCYMLKYWPNKGVVMIKATKEMFKRKLEDLT